MRRKNSDNPGNNFTSLNFSRRTLMKSSLLGGGAAFAGALFGGLIPEAALGVDPSSKYEGPIVETTAGKVRGVLQGGTHIFRGIPYGASTAGIQPLHASPQAGAVDRSARSFPERPDRAATGRPAEPAYFES